MVDCTLPKSSTLISESISKGKLKNNKCNPRLAWADTEKDLAGSSLQAITCYVSLGDHIWEQEQLYHMIIEQMD